jgi:hypothetical protein
VRPCHLVTIDLATGACISSTLVTSSLLYPHQNLAQVDWDRSPFADNPCHYNHHPITSSILPHAAHDNDPTKTNTITSPTNENKDDINVEIKTPETTSTSSSSSSSSSSSLASLHKAQMAALNKMRGVAWSRREWQRLAIAAMLSTCGVDLARTNRRDRYYRRYDSNDITMDDHTDTNAYDYMKMNGVPAYCIFDSRDDPRYKLPTLTNTNGDNKDETNDDSDDSDEDATPYPIPSVLDVHRGTRHLIDGMPSSRSQSPGNGNDILGRGRTNTNNNNDDPDRFMPMVWFIGPTPSTTTTTPTTNIAAITPSAK